MKRADDDAQRADDLAATSESLQADAERVSEIEEEKRDLELGDPRVIDLSREAERIAGQIQEKSRIERDLAEGDHDRGTAPDRPN